VAGYGRKREKEEKRWLELVAYRVVVYENWAIIRGKEMAVAWQTG